MRRIVGLVCACLLGVVAVSAQQPQGVKRPRFHKPADQQAVAPVVTITTPTANSTFSQTSAAVALSGTCAGCATLVWGDGTLSDQPVSGLADWTIASSASAQTVFQDTFTDTVKQNANLHTPSIGTGWAEAVDTLGTLAMQVRTTGDANPTGSDSTGTNTLIWIATPNPAISGTNYDVSLELMPGAYGPSSTSQQGIVFGYADADNYCALVLRSSVQSPDVHLVKHVAGVITELGAGANVGPLNGQVYKITVRTGGIVTVYLNDAQIYTATDTFCDNAVGVGIGWGALRNSTGTSISTSALFGSFSVDDQDSSSGIALDAAPSTKTITVTGCDATTPTPLCGSDTIAITRTASDTTAPAITILSPQPSGTYNAAAATLTVSGTSSDNVGVSSVTCAYNGGSCGGSVTGTTSWSVNVSLTSGTHNLVLTATDAAMNTATATLAVNYTPADVTAPTVVISTNGGSNFTSATSPVALAGTAADTGGSGLLNVTYACTASSGTATGTSSWSATVLLSPGANACSATAHDVAGNPSTADTITITYTGTLTIVTASLSPATEDVAMNARTLVASGGVLPLTWDNNGAGTTLNDGDAQCAGMTISSAGVISGTPTTTGTCNFTAKVTDSAGSPATATKALAIVIQAAGATGPNSFFDDARMRSDFFKGYSLRQKPDGSSGGSASNSAYDYKYQLATTAAAGTSQDGFVGVGCPQAGTSWSYGQQSSSDASADAHPHAQDAAKATQQPFVYPGNCNTIAGTTGQLTRALSATLNADGTALSTVAGADRIQITGPVAGNMAEGNRAQMIENEITFRRICTVAEGGNGSTRVLVATNEVCVTRGAFGTTIAAHAIGTYMKISGNQLQGGLTLPISDFPSRTVTNPGTTGGHTWLLVQDFFWTDDYMRNHGWNNGKKTMVLHPTYRSKLFEPSIFFTCGSGKTAGGTIPGCDLTNDIGRVFVRAYNSNNSTCNGCTDWDNSNGNTLGESVGINSEDIDLENDFVIRPNKWVRIWIYVDQVDDDWDLISMYMADETTPMVRVAPPYKWSIEGQNPVGTGVISGTTVRSDNIIHWHYPEGDSSTEFGVGFDALGVPATLASYTRNFFVLKDPPAPASWNAEGLDAQPIAAPVN